MSNSKWNERYMAMAKEVAQWSKDPNTKVGAVAVGEKGQILSQGYNGFPRGIIDTPRRLNDRETKLSLVVHAEMNAIFNATYSGVSLDKATIFKYLFLNVCLFLDNIKCFLAIIVLTKYYTVSFNLKTKS